MRNTLNKINYDDDFDDDVLEDGPADGSGLSAKRDNTLEDSYAKAKTDNTLTVDDLDMLSVILKFGFFKELVDDTIAEPRVEENGMDVELNYRDPGSKFPADEYMHFPKYIRGDANIVTASVPRYTQEFLYELIQVKNRDFVDNDDAKVLANISILEFISFNVINKIWGLLAEEKVLIFDFTQLMLKFPDYHEAITNFINLATQRRRIFAVGLDLVATYENHYLFTDSARSIDGVQVSLNNNSFNRHILDIDDLFLDVDNYIECCIYNLNQLERINTASRIMKECKHSVKLLSKPGANKKQDLGSLNIMFNLFWRILGATASIYSDKIKVDLNRATGRTLKEFYDVLPKELKVKTVDVYTAANNIATVTHDFTIDVPGLNIQGLKNSITVFYNMVSRYYDSDFRVIYCPYLTKEESTYLVSKELDMDFSGNVKKEVKESANSMVDNDLLEDESNTPIDVKPNKRERPGNYDRRSKPNKARETKSSMMDELDDEPTTSFTDSLKSFGGRLGAAYHNRNHNGELDIKRKHAKRKAKSASSKAAKGLFKGTKSGLKYAIKNPRGILRLMLILAGGFIIFNIALALIKLLGIL